jgi:hypothetical protein
VSESLTLPCPRCGASLPADPTAPAVTCRYCREIVAIPPELRRRALEYASRVGAARQRAEQEAKAIGQYRFWSQHQYAGLVPALVILPLMIALGIASNVLEKVLPKGAMSVIMPVAIYGTLGAFAFVYYRKYKNARAGDAAALPVAAGTCARCGGPLTFEAGSAAAVCRACNATAIAGKTIQRDLASAAERHARRLETERVAAERQTYRTIAQAQSFGRWYAYFAMGLPLGLIGVLSFGAGAERLVSALASGKAKAIADGVAAFAVGSSVALVIAAIGAAVYLIFVRPARRTGAALRAFAARIGGALQEGSPVPALDWLDRFWWGPTGYEVAVAQQELLRYTLTTVLGGLPAMIVVLAGGTHVKVSRLHVLVAAPRARDERAALASPAARELAALGFTVRACEDGIALTHPNEGPALVNEATLAWVLQAATAVARA